MTPADPNRSHDRRARYDAALRLALAWLHEQQGADGSFGTTASDSVGAIMVTPITCLWGGRPDGCLGVLDHIRRRYIQADGDLARPALATSVADQRQQPYALSWIVCSAAACGALDLAHRCVAHVIRHQHDPSGGLFGTTAEAEAGDGLIDMASTGMGGLALVATGHLDRARAVGDYIVDWLGRQPEDPLASRRLQPQWDTRTGLVDEADAARFPENANAPIVLDHSPENAAYWLCGILLAVLTDLILATGDPRYQEAARRIFDFAAASPELGRRCTSHKFAWGAARLYDATHDPAHLEGACRVADWLVSTQRPDGTFFHTDRWAANERPPRLASVGITSQFGAWISSARMRMPQSAC